MRTYEQSHDRHFIDLYMTKMLNDQMENKKSSFSCNNYTFLAYDVRFDVSGFDLLLFFILLTDDQLILTCIDFSFPALSAVNTVVTFLIQQICIQPEIQKKIQNEIDKVVGQGRMPTLDDRIK